MAHYLVIAPMTDEADPENSPWVAVSLIEAASDDEAEEAARAFAVSSAQRDLQPLLGSDPHLSFEKARELAEAEGLLIGEPEVFSIGKLVADISGIDTAIESRDSAGAGGCVGGEP